jgi:hypothetical protein
MMIDEEQVSRTEVEQVVDQPATNIGWSSTKPIAARFIA